jgi:cytochrome c oxidase assembly factor CtaG
VAFVSGVLVLLVGTCSFLGVYDRVLFWPRAVQNVVLLMAVPMLMALGAPITLLLAEAPAAVVGVLRRFAGSRPAALLGSPLVATLALLVPLPVLYLSGLYELTLADPWVDSVARAGLVGCGFLYYWTRLRIDPAPGTAVHVVSFAITFAESLVDGILGVVVWLGPLISPAYYLALGRHWGPSLRADQTAGAVALWFGGDLISLPYLAALLAAWTRSDERAARSVDAELDALAAGADRRDGVDRLAERASVHDPDLQDGLWWESDPRFADRFAPRPAPESAPERPDDGEA